MVASLHGGDPTVGSRAARSPPPASSARPRHCWAWAGSDQGQHKQNDKQHEAPEDESIPVDELGAVPVILGERRKVAEFVVVNDISVRLPDHAHGEGG